MLKIVDFYNLTKNAKKSKIVNFLYFHFDHVKAKGAGGGQFFMAVVLHECTLYIITLTCIFQEAVGMQQCKKHWSGVLDNIQQHK